MCQPTYDFDSRGKRYRAGWTFCTRALIKDAVTELTGRELRRLRRLFLDEEADYYRRRLEHEAEYCRRCLEDEADYCLEPPISGPSFSNSRSRDYCYGCGERERSYSHYSSSRFGS
ncbi:hypothetical protein ISF_00227 [Cordyceps fumosorosea ARSEF 2679]|uniref:Uncharacterized protein n=1 Tax=Cordyceps fumosorosea (strain ARSEF 2679) TaxID=1081104 RepID=A0A168E3B0_CORFA|nr:hypothetical protein ISF_00227 [Cordyceps fumosorosea ARSEF 2679]OAA73326.1 hypothetical protein ISF_00227 [Cordyceps fumosorosea ARSEF 2679]